MIAYILRIANIVDNGSEILWMTRHPTPPSGTVRACLDRVPTLSAASVEMLAPVASGSGGVFSGTGSEGRPLLRRDLGLPNDATVRLTKYCTAVDTSITTDRPGLTVPQTVYIGGETMTLDAETSSGVYDVTRAIGTLGVAREHRWVYGEPAPLVLTRPSDPRGMRCSVHSWDGTTETLVWRGMVRGASRTAHGFAVDVVSCLGWLLDREYGPAQVQSVNGGPYNQATTALDELTALYAQTLTDSWEPQYARVWFGDAWMVQATASPETLITGDESQWNGTGGDILQWGTGGVVCPLSVIPSGLPPEFGTPTRVEGLYSTPGAAPSAVLTALLTAQWPPGQVGGMDADDIGDLSALDRAWGSGDLLPPFRTSGDWWTPPVKAGKLTEALGKGLFGPLGLCLTTDLFGRLTVLDWLDVLGGTVALTEAETMTGLGAVTDTQPVRVVKWTPSGTGDAPVEWRSDLVSQVSGGGRVIEASPGWVQDAGAWLADRFGAILQVYQFAVPTVPVEVRIGYALSEGLAAGVPVALTNSTVWNREGLRGVTAMSGVILGTARELHERGGMVTCTVALTGYSVNVDAVRWCPSGVITLAVGTLFTVTMDDGSDVDDWFTVGLPLVLTDSDGAMKDATLTVVSSNATQVLVSGLGAAVAPGDRLTYGPGVAGRAYLSTGCDYV